MSPFAALLAFAVLAVGAGCMDSRLRNAGRDGTPVEAAPPDAPRPNTIGSGNVKVALILPLTGQGANVGQSLRNAAELALAEFQGADLAITVKDDRGTPDGAREAAASAVADGAQAIIGPLFAPTVAAAGEAARGAGKPVIAFSTDSSVAGRGVYLLSFTPQPEVERVMTHAASQGRRSFAALIPETTYGNVVEAEFREVASRQGLRVVAVERYPPGQPAAAVGRLAGVVGGDNPGADALLIPDSGESLAAVGTALAGTGFSASRVKPLGTGVWGDGRAGRVPAVQGGWYAAPDGGTFAAFASRYRAKFGAEPTRIASLAYDAVNLVAALVRAGNGSFAESALRAPSGFAGIDGTFRFRPDGTNDRALAVLELRGAGTSVVSPAPRALGSGI